MIEAIIFFALGFFAHTGWEYYKKNFRGPVS